MMNTPQTSEQIIPLFSQKQIFSASSVVEWGRLTLQLAQQRRTYRNLLYLLLSIPLGLSFCGFLLIGIAGSIWLLYIGIGIPLLYLMIAAWWGLAIFERAFTNWGLQVNIPMLPRSLLSLKKGRFITHVRLHLSQKITWKTLAYLLAKGPFSLCVGMLIIAGLLFSFCASLLIVSSGLLILPFLILWGAIAMMKQKSEYIFSQYRWLFLASIAAILAPLGLLNGVADFWGHFSRIMLSINESERELLQTREQLQQERMRADRAERQRRDLIANLSHDLRTPVANIRGHAEALIKLAQETNENVSLPASHQAYLSIIHREAVRLGTLFDELLALARAESDELQISLHPVDVSIIIDEVYQTIKPLAYRERRITLSKSVPAGLPSALADPQRLRQVLLNLVRNAITYTPEGGLVAITLQQADKQHIVLAIADTGIGIAQEDQERIFERFYRTDRSRSSTTGGSGLGLAIVRELVEAMGGKITVESRPDEGSCFSILLPIN